MKPQLLTVEEIAKRLVGKKKHTFEAKNDYKDYPCPRCGAMTNRDGSYCWQVKAKQLLKSMV